MEESAPDSGEVLETRCANCGAELAGDFCHRCGQRRFENDLSLAAITRDTVSHVLDVEHSKILRSLWTLLAQPGLLTNDFIAGRRVEWIAPLRLYLTVFAVSLFLYSAFQTVALYDLRNIIRLDRSGKISEAVAKLTARKHVAQDVFINQVNARWHNYVSLSQIVYPIFFAIFLKLFYFRRRAGEHLAFSLHYNAVIFLIVILAWPLYMLTGLALTSRSAILAFVVTAAFIAYLVVALRKVYGQSWIASIIKGLVLYLGYYLVYIVVLYGSLGIAIIVSARHLGS